jgi:hypothetical protein
MTDWVPHAVFVAQHIGVNHASFKCAVFIKNAVDALKIPTKQLPNPDADTFPPQVMSDSWWSDYGCGWRCQAESAAGSSSSTKHWASGPWATRAWWQQLTAQATTADSGRPWNVPEPPPAAAATGHGRAAWAGARGRGRGRKASEALPLARAVPMEFRSKGDRGVSIRWLKSLLCRTSEFPRRTTARGTKLPRRTRRQRVCICRSACQVLRAVAPRRVPIC